ncbi:monocarboxylate transporter 12-like [Amphiura filiformis]|uniref:monocarboxylate transporter 12-like n=1 Tax=Amphiura filiformis TaxID=82378 RepID=UPI003B21A0FA
MITSLLVDSLNYIIATFAVAGLGLGIAFLSAQTVLLFNFDKHLGKATSLANCGSGVGMFVIPPSFRYLLDEFGWRGCLFIAAGIYSNICVCGAFLRPSPSEKHMRNDRKVMVTTDAENTSFVGQTSDPNDLIFTRIMKLLQGIKNSLDISLFYTNARFVAYFVVGFLCGMCFPPIFIYLAPKAVQSGLTKTEASFLLSFAGFGSIIGRFATGVFVDYSPFPLSKIYSLSYLISGILALLLPLGNTFAVLATISVASGFSAGFCHCLHIFVAKEFVGLDRLPGAVSWYNANYAIGSSVSIFLAGYLVDLTGSYRASFMTAGGCALLTAVILFTEPRLQQLYESHCKRHAIGQGGSEFRHKGPFIISTGGVAGSRQKVTAENYMTPLLR